MEEIIFLMEQVFCFADKMPGNTVAWDGKKKELSYGFLVILEYNL